MAEYLKEPMAPGTELFRPSKHVKAGNYQEFDGRRKVPPDQRGHYREFMGGQSMPLAGEDHNMAYQPSMGEPFGAMGSSGKVHGPGGYHPFGDLDKAKLDHAR